MRAKFVWQDWLNLAALLFGFCGWVAEDVLFLVIYSLAATSVVLISIRSHHELSTSTKAIAMCVMVVIVASLDVHQYRSIQAKELSANYGELYPAGEAAPLSTCPIPFGAIALYAGKSVAWHTDFPMTVLMIGDRKLLTLDKTKSGGLLVNADVFDERGNLVAKITNTHYIATNYSSHFERIDKSSLAVYDHADRLALQIRFINENAVQIGGTFNSPDGGQTVYITKDAIRTGSLSDDGACMGGFVRSAFHF